MSGPLLEVSDVEAGYGDALVLRGVSLAASPGELVAIIGPNGAGKSTLLKVVYGLLRPRAGTIRYAGNDVTGLQPEQLTRLGLNYVPQLANVFPSLSIAENLQVGCVSLPRAERRQALNDLYAHFTLLEERRRQRAGALADRGYVLDMGRNAHEGAGRALLHDPKVEELYLGGSRTASSSTSTSALSGINAPT